MTRWGIILITPSCLQPLFLGLWRFCWKFGFSDSLIHMIGAESGVWWGCVLIGAVSDGIPLFSLFGIGPLLLRMGWKLWAVICWCLLSGGLCAIQLVGLRVSLMVYNLDVGLLELFLTTATPPSSSIILNNISSLLPFVIKMSQQQVGSLVLTIIVDDLMSILYSNLFVSINPLMVWWEKSQSFLYLVSR